MRINITKICLIIFVLLFSVKVEAVTKPSFYIKDVTKYSNSNKVVIEIYSENILHLLTDVFIRLVNIKYSSWSFVISISNTTCIFASLYSPFR